MKLDFTLMSAGYCTHLECISIKGGGWCSQKFPALCALLEHPHHGKILFDTGYSPRFFQETKTWPFWLYKMLTPVKISQQQTLCMQLQQKGIQPRDINHIILSHFHADHIAGVKDFPNAQFICSKTAFDDVRDSKSIKALRKGYLSGLLPMNFESRLGFVEQNKAIALDQSMAPFLTGFDLFGDGSLVAIELPGHAAGQIGLLFKDEKTSKDIFLVADSCWSSEAYREYKLPSAITYLIHDQKNAYQSTLLKLHELYKENKSIHIIPSHCHEIWQSLNRDSGNA